LSVLNKIESVGLRKYLYYSYFTKKLMSQYQTFRRACPALWRETADVDTV